MICGILVTFRSPVTKHVPVLAGLMGGLWDLWRNRTLADQVGEHPVDILLSTMGRSAIFVVRLLLEVVINVIQDHEKRPGGGPPIFTPELVAAALGAWQGLERPKHYTFVSGWELPATPIAPGTRAVARTPEAMAKQTLTMIRHPEGHQRFTPTGTERVVHDDSAAGGRHDAGGRESATRQPAGGMEWRAREGRGHRRRVPCAVRARCARDPPVPWGGPRHDRRSRRRGVSRHRSCGRPVLDCLPGTDIRLTPSASLSLGVKSGAEENSYRPALTFRLALNDLEDRVTFMPDDELLVQLLPS